MSTSKTITLTYDAPLERVSAMQRDPEFRRQVLAGIKASAAEVTVNDGDVEIRYARSVSGLPSFAKRFIGETIEVSQHETWRDAASADLEYRLPGKPGSLTGSIRLREDAGRTTETITLTAQVNVPLAGSKLEGLVLSVMEKAFAKENEVGATYLAS